MTLTRKQFLDGVWYGAFVVSGFGWLVAHYYIERHGPELYIVIGAGACLAYGIWGIKKTDFKSFAHDAGEAYGEFRKGDDK